MTFRALVADRLGRLLGVLSHPYRLRIVEEIGREERDVGSLRDALGISQSLVSQHLSLLRSHDLVVERRAGRHVFYRLREPRLAVWLVDGLRFIDPGEAQDELRAAVEDARATWGASVRPRAAVRRARA